MALKDSQMHKASFPSPLNVLKEGIRAVPSVKYALGIAGVGAALLMILAMIPNLAIAGFGIVAMLLLMVILVLLAHLVKADKKTVRKPMLAFTWSAWAIVMVVAGLFVSCLFFRKPLDLSSLVSSRQEHNLKVSNLHADCSQYGFCTIEVEIANRGSAHERVTGFRYQVIDFRALGTMGGLQSPDVLGDLDLSNQTPSSTVWRYAHRKAPDILDPRQERSLVLKVTARDLVKGFGLWTLRPVLETSVGDLPLKDVQLMLPHWDTHLLPGE